MTAEKVEVIPLLPPPFLNCFIGSFMLTCKIVELGVDLSGDEEFMQAWYPHCTTLPIIAPLAKFFGALSVPLWFVLIIFTLPAAVRGKASYLSCFPVAGIPVMACGTIRTFMIIGPSQFPSPEVRGELVQARAVLLLVCFLLLLFPNIEFKASIRGISKGFRKTASSKKQEASAKGVPEGMEIVPLMTPPLFELCGLSFLLTLCVADYGVILTGDQALMAAWARGRDKVPTVLFALCGIAVGACCKVARALWYKLPEAARRAPGSFAGCSPLVLAPSLFAAWQFSELSKAAAVLKGAIVFVAMCCTLAELGIVMKDVTHAELPVANGAGAKGGEKVE